MLSLKDLTFHKQKVKNDNSPKQVHYFAVIYQLLHVLLFLEVSLQDRCQVTTPEWLEHPVAQPVPKVF